MTSITDITLSKALAANKAIPEPRDEASHERVESDIEESTMSVIEVTSLLQSPQRTKSGHIIKKPHKM